jgi:hypothetical protein
MATSFARTKTIVPLTALGILGGIGLSLVGVGTAQAEVINTGSAAQAVRMALATDSNATQAALAASGQAATQVNRDLTAEGTEAPGQLRAAEVAALTKAQVTAAASASQRPAGLAAPRLGGSLPAGLLLGR